MAKQDTRVVIQYMEDIPAEHGPEGHRQYVAGETYVVKDAAKAAEKHPLATIVRYADGGKYDPSNPRVKEMPSTAESGGSKKRGGRKNTTENAPDDASASEGGNEGEAPSQ